MLRAIKDQLGHEVYLTDERWNHICEEHPEMSGYESRVLETVERGRRFQDSVRLDVFLYYWDYGDLPHGNTTIVVVVHFGYDPDGTENNFIVTAYQVFRQRR